MSYDEHMRDGQLRLMQLAVEKAESELRTQRNVEHQSILGLQITQLRKEESEVSLETSKLVRQNEREHSNNDVLKLKGNLSS